MERIAAQARISERGARYAVAALEESGELVVKREKGAVANQTWNSRNIYSIPGVVKDGFYRERLPKPAATGAAGDEEPAAKPAAKNTTPSGKASGNELPSNYPKELRESKREQDELPPTTSSSKSKPPSYGTFQSRYYSLIGITPAEIPLLVNKYLELCSNYGEDAVLDFISTWADGQGGAKSLGRDKYGPGNFLKQVETMLTTERVSDSDRKEASYPHGTEDNFDWDKFNELKRKGEN